MTPKTVTIAVVLAVGGVLLGMNYPIAEAQQDGPYALSAVGGGVGDDDAGATYAWRINTRTGAVSVCGLLFPRLMLVKPDFSAQQGLDVPKCSPWGPAAGH